MAGKMWRQDAPSDIAARPDANVMSIGGVGIPPETVLGGLSAGRAIAKSGPGLVTKGKAAVGQIAPVVKYETVRHGLEMMGAPPWLSYPIATILAGHGGRGKATSTVAAEAAPVEAAATQAVTAPVVAEEAAAVLPSGRPVLRPHPEGGVWSPTRIKSEVGLQGIRQGIKLTPEQFQAAEKLVAEGQMPVDVVKAIKSGAVATPSKFKLKSGPELAEYVRLTKMGKSPKDAADAIQMLRDMAAKFGTPSTESVLSKVADRNATGRWR